MTRGMYNRRRHNISDEIAGAIKGYRYKSDGGHAQFYFCKVR